MKCPMCGGDGKVLYPGVANYYVECGKCHGTGEVEQTNEEWLKSCNTEQLAEVLWERINGAFNSGYACCLLKQDKDYIGRYKRFKEWLKQPHKEEQ